MELRDLVKAVLANDVLGARQWVADALRARVSWSRIERPEGLGLEELSLAAGLAEMMAQRAGVAPPSWTAQVGGVPREVLLVQAARTMRRLRQLCLEEGPMPLRSRGFLAPPGFLEVA